VQSGRNILTFQGNILQSPSLEIGEGNAKFLLSFCFLLHATLEDNTC
jgi:hypothetical protein